MDFSGSTNVVLLLPTRRAALPKRMVASATTAAPRTVANDKRCGSGGAKEGGGESGTEEGAEMEMETPEGGVAGNAEAAPESAGASKTAKDSNKMVEGGEGLVLLSAQISVEAFVRTVVARVTVRDSEAGGTVIKVGSL